MLAAFARDYPQVRLEVHSGLSHEIWQRFEAGELIWLWSNRCGDRGAARLLARTAGLGRQPCLARQRAGSLPLVVFPSEGLYRRQVTEALDGMGRRWRIAYVSASLASLQGR